MKYLAIVFALFSTPVWACPDVVTVEVAFTSPISVDTFREAKVGWNQVFASTSTFREFLEVEICIFGDRPSPSASIGDADICHLLDGVGGSCTYEGRFSLVRFLAFHGMELFPADGGSNPYVTEQSPESVAVGDPDNAYIGTGPQNNILFDAIRRNQMLFSDGELSANELASWQLGNGWAAAVAHHN